MVFKRVALGTMLLLAGVMAGCIYSFKGSLPSYIKYVAVPLFDDNTAYPNVRENLTNSIIAGFTNDNTLKVSSEANADIIVSGTIMSIARRAAVLTSGEEVESYQMFVNVKVKCEDIKNNKTMWEKNLSAFGVMSATATQDEIDAAINDAIIKLAEDILNNTLANW
jgi:pyruvate dehydrogenase complex dehydrogenase (E1) component